MKGIWNKVLMLQPFLKMREIEITTRTGYSSIPGPSFLRFSPDDTCLPATLPSQNPHSLAAPRTLSTSQMGTSELKAHLYHCKSSLHYSPKITQECDHLSHFAVSPSVIYFLHLKIISIVPAQALEMIGLFLPYSRWNNRCMVWFTVLQIKKGALYLKPFLYFYLIQNWMLTWELFSSFC